MNRTELKEQIEQRWPGHAQCRFDAANSISEITCAHAVLAELCGRLFLEWNFSFAGLIVEEGAGEWQLRYCFYGDVAAAPPPQSVAVTPPSREKQMVAIGDEASSSPAATGASPPL